MNLKRHPRKASSGTYTNKINTINQIPYIDIMVKENFVKIYENSIKDNWDLPALTNYADKNTLSYKDLGREIMKLHLFFEETGMQRGDKIALIGRNNALWCTVYLATVSYGCIIVPILQDFHPDNVHHIVNHSEARFLFTSDQIWENLDEAQMTEIEGIFSLTNLRCLFEKNKNTYSGLVSSLDERMDKKYPEGFTKEDVKFAEVSNKDLIVLNYTSGTTGFSKGVMLTANNLAGNVVFLLGQDVLQRGERLVSFLPLAHAYGCTVDFLYTLAVGVHVILLGKTPSPKILLQALGEYKPHLIVTVPLVVEKIYKKAILSQLESKPLKMALNIPILNQKIYSKIGQKLIDLFGGNFRQIIIGGAPLSAEVEAFFLKVKIPLTVGYGMTECAPLISYSKPTDFAPSSCGHVLKGYMEVRVDSSDPYNSLGEIQVKGENVMKGYYKNEEATKAAFTKDGWLRTGDLGTIDEEGRIFLRGRSKTMILGPSGQNIFPEEIEAKLNNMPYIMESLVMSREGKLIALIYPDYESMDAAGISSGDLKDLMELNKVNVNKILSNFEQLSAIHIYPNEFEKTPKKSIKRYLYDK